MVMTRRVHLSIRIDGDLRDQFKALAASRHCPAAQIIRELMRRYIDSGETPNALTARTLRKSRDGKDIFHSANASDLFKELAMPRYLQNPGRQGL